MTTPGTLRSRQRFDAPAQRHRSPAAAPGVTITQYSRRAIYAIWAAAALPMAALAWIIAPAIAGTGPGALSRALLVVLCGGLAWQFLLVIGLIAHEQRSLRWSRLRQALWLRSPRSPRTGRAGGRTWLVLVPLIIGFGLEEMIPSFSPPFGRDLGEFLQSDAGKALFHGSWAWFGLMVAMTVFNTVLGEELLFRGVLLPRMRGAFGERDWVANGVLFAIYHLHMPWAIPADLLDTVFISYPTKRFQSAWIGIAVHSAQSVVILPLVLALVV